MRLKDRATRLAVAIIASTGLNAFASKTEPKIEAVPGEYLVKMKSPIGEEKAALNVLSSRLGAVVKSTIPSMNIAVVQRASFETEKSVREVFAGDSDVEYIEPNYIYSINRTPDDPMLGQLWGMHNATNPGMDINALQAWDIETGNPNLVVAIIDTGINYNHPDLRANMWVNEAEANGTAGVDDDGNGVVDDIHGYNAAANTGDPMDDNGHGTHCAGTIGAKGNDGQGIVGVAWNVKLMGAKFLTASGSGTLEGAVRAIDYANRMGAKVLSNSWGGGGFSQALFDVIENSNLAGSVFVAAAGNSSSNNDAQPSYPASYEVSNIIAVAAVDNKGKLADFSSYGKRKVHVAAPGVDIVSSVGDGYEAFSGTSMATPHVSGVVALMLSKNPELSSTEVRDRLVSTSRRIAGLKTKVVAKGTVDAYAALLNIVPEPDMNDPEFWQTVPVAVSTEHPYANDFTSTYEVNVPGARQIAIFFEKFETEGRYDTLTIKDANGNVVEILSGENSGAFSAVIEGEKATLEFKTDHSVNRHGFDITKAAYR